jgi:hypothetical protein
MAYPPRLSMVSSFTQPVVLSNCCAASLTIGRVDNVPCACDMTGSSRDLGVLGGVLRTFSALRPSSRHSIGNGQTEEVQISDVALVQHAISSRFVVLCTLSDLWHCLW